MREWSLSWCLSYRLDAEFVAKLDTWFPALIAIIRRYDSHNRLWHISLRRFLPVDIAEKILDKCFLNMTERQNRLPIVSATIMHRDACGVHDAAGGVSSPRKPIWEDVRKPIWEDVRFAGVPGLPGHDRVSLSERLRLAAIYAGHLHAGRISLEVVCKSTLHLKRILRQVSVDQWQR